MPPRRKYPEFPCDQCETIFLRKDGLIRHKMQVHPKNLRITLQRCHTKLKIPSPPRRHNDSRVHESHFKCCKCDKSFVSPSKLKRHEETVHATTRPWKCNFCDKLFTIEDYKNRHLRSVHLQEKYFPCSYPSCNFYFSARKELRLHEQTHLPLEERERYQCELCDKGYFFAKSLSDHKKVIHESKRFPCMIPRCEETFVSRAHLKRHLGSHPDPQINIHQPERILECMFCQTRFKHNKHRIVHLRVHIGEKWYHCKICQKSFVNTYTLRTHMKKHNMKIVERSGRG